MKKSIFSAVLLAAGLSFGAQAAEINVGGVVWDPDVGSDFTSVGSTFESFAAGVGSTVQGYGKISELNATNETVFCPGCELTYGFDFQLTYSQYSTAVFDGTDTIITTTTQSWNGISVDVVVDVATAPGVDIAGSVNTDFDFEFDNATLDFYVDDSQNFDGNAPLQAEATDGDLWLSLVNNGVVQGTADDLFNVNLIDGSGFGFLDVVSGLAFTNFDTNFFSDANDADMRFDSSFNLLQGIASEPGFPLGGSISFKADTIPEPSSLAILGLGLIGLGFGSRRRLMK
jgi:hypothetical protein